MIETKDQKPAGWKNYEDFSAGIATNRLPSTDGLIRKSFQITLNDGSMLKFSCSEEHALKWADNKSGKTEWYETILVAPMSISWIQLSLRNQKKH